MPQLLDQTRVGGTPPAAPTLLGDRDPTQVGERGERAARHEMRRQIALLERQSGELFASAFPRRGFDWGVAAAGGPRVLGIADLERVRDRLVEHLAATRAELGLRAELEERSRELIESMIARPEEHRWVRVSNEDLGEAGCRHWHSRPRWGVIGALLGWWRVKLSSGCPLAVGRGSAAPRTC